MLSEAIKTGNLDEELKGIECPEQYRREAEVIREMHNDYFLVRAQIKTLPWSDFKVLDSYLKGSHDLLKLADETDCTYDGVKNRLKRARNRIGNLVSTTDKTDIVRGSIQFNGIVFG